MRGCEEAKKFEKEKIDEPLTTFNATKVSYLTNRGIAPGQGMLLAVYSPLLLGTDVRL